MPKIFLTNRFRKSFERLDKRIQERIKKAIKDICNNPYCGKKLTGDLAGEYSYRVGRYRIIYTMEKEIIWIETVAHRKIVYRHH